MTSDLFNKGLTAVFFSLLLSYAYAQAPQTQNTVNPTEQKAQPQQANANGTPAPAPKIFSAPPMPETGADTLPIGDQQDLAQLMSEGPCPCDQNPDPNQKKSMLTCIQEKSCPAATNLAKLGVQKYKEGLSKEQVFDAIINKYLEENTPPMTFEVKNTPAKGNPNAKVIMVEFADFQCPHCALMKNIMKEVVEKHKNDVVLYFKQFPLPFHPYAALASKATLAANRQGSFWQMHDLIFDNQMKLDEAIFKQFAAQLNLNVEKFEADMNDPELQKEIERNLIEGQQAGLTGTPTLFINGKQYRGESTVEKISEKIMLELKGTK